MSANPKRLIVCCDGTWMNSDNGFEETSHFRHAGKIQTPSNVTRIARAFERTSKDGRSQIVNYQSGVGTGSTLADIVTGGAFGLGVAEHIRAAYSYIVANYVDGDDIVLIGFSRGAFTARSVAGMIGDLGLLTVEGMDHFYPIFKDLENWRTPDYEDPFPELPFPDKPHGDNAEEVYRAKLLERGYTRVKQANGDWIKVKAVAVWDTVGSLGIPKADILARLGFKGSTKEFNFYDTALSDKIEHAFQALALDETRPPFSPAIWERTAVNRLTTDLRQVWFPGNHGNVGGGWPDQGIANLSLAWMMDQLTTLGIDFRPTTIRHIAERTASFYDQEAASQAAKLAAQKAHPSLLTTLLSPFSSSTPKPRPQWALTPLYAPNAPRRPWALGAIQHASSLLYTLAGAAPRHPGTYRRIDPLTGRDTPVFLEDTNERVHASVRARLAAAGLGLDDAGPWTCAALAPAWRLRRTDERFFDPVPGAGGQAVVVASGGEGGGAGAGADGDIPPKGGDGGRWVWEWAGAGKEAPAVRTMVEETLGPYERELLALTGGKPNVLEFVDGEGLKGVPKAE